MDTCVQISDSAQQTEQIGVFLADSMMTRPVYIALQGDMGAGKTTFIKGLAKGLGITDLITSPTYAVESRYGDVLSHIDLHRLPEKSMEEVLMSLHAFPGIVVIEWADRAQKFLAQHDRIHVQIEEIDEKTRRITIDFHDMAIPDDAMIAEMHKEYHTAAHIIEHEKRVADIAEHCANDMMKHGHIIRMKALRAAALLHDVLRIVDFQDPAPAEHDLWKKLRTQFGNGHESAAQQMLAARGFPEIGMIIRPHGMPGGENPRPVTIEQKLLAYADKRVLHTDVVSVEERFADFAVRYGGGKESPAARTWKESVLALEQELFPDGPPA